MCAFRFETFFFFEPRKRPYIWLFGVVDGRRMGDNERDDFDVEDFCLFVLLFVYFLFSA